MFKLLLSVLVSFLLLGCSLQEFQESLLDDEVKAELERLNEALLSGDTDYINSKFHPSVLSQIKDGDLENALSFVPKGDLVKIEIATVKFTKVDMFSGYSSVTYNVSYALEFKDRWALFIYTLIDEGEGLKLVGFHINQSDISYKEAHAFTLKGKSFLHYGVLFWALVVLGGIIWTLIKAFQEKNFKRKALWLIFIAIGVGGFSLNWTTGAWAFQTLNVSLLGAGYMAAGYYSPIILKVSFPLGAALFWIFKKQGKLK